MSNSIDKTKLGAGDGLRTPTITHSSKIKRTAVPSSRRFTPRTPSLDNERSESMQQRLQEAMDSVSLQSRARVNSLQTEHQRERTPIPMRCKRAQTVAEITPSKKVVHYGGLFGSATKDQGLTMTKKASSSGTRTGNSGSGTIIDGVTSLTVIEKRDEYEDEQRERRNVVEAAGRRVYSQLLLNAWRHKRRDATLLADSSTLLQQQVQQLQMQIDVLQQLRQAEGRRRSEAAQDSCQLRVDLEKCEEKCQELLQEKDDLLRKQAELENDLTCLKMELTLEQDNVSKLTRDLVNEEENVKVGVNVINELKNEKDLLENKVKLLEDILERENRKIKNMSCDIVNMENTIHGEMLRNKKYVTDLDTIQNLLKFERDQVKNVKQELLETQQHQTKTYHKMADLKKRLTVINEIKRRVLQDNCDLNRTVIEMQILLQKEREKPWWRTSGQLMYTFVHNAAYLLLPNLPKNDFYGRKKIATTLDSNETIIEGKNLTKSDRIKSFFKLK